MSRLDRHVMNVQNKLALHRLLEALAWAAFGYACAAFLAIAVFKLVQYRLPHQARVAQVLGGVAVALSLAYALWRRPDARLAAVAIDRKLGLKEKFSTALYVRNSSDPFARAAVLDAEHTAEAVQLGRQFPVKAPRVAYAALGVALAAFLTAWLVTPMDLFGRVAETKRQEEQKQLALVQAQHRVSQAMAAINSMPEVLANTEDIQKIVKELQQLSQEKNPDPAGMNRKAVEALEDVKKALAEAGERDRRVMAAQNQAFHQTMAPLDEKGPLGNVAKDLKNNDMDKAVKDLDEALQDFDKLKPEEKEAAAKQMQDLADAMKKMAEDPQARNDLENALKKMDADPAQVQQAVQAMQQAAQGNQAAQQQLQQIANQMQGNLQKQIQQAQAQAAAGSQQAQQQLSQLQAQQTALSQAMKIAQAQAGAQASANSMAQDAQQLAQAMQAQAQGSQSNPNGQMGGGQQAVKNAMGALQAMQKDAAQTAAAQQKANGQDGNCNGNCNGNGQGNQNGNKNGPGGTGQWTAGDPQNQGNGQGGPGIGNGGRGGMEMAPYDVSPEMDPSKENESGKILARSLVKDHSVRGESKATISQIAESKLTQATDEVETQRVSGQGRKAAEEYFSTIARENKDK